MKNVINYFNNVCIKLNMTEQTLINTIIQLENLKFLFNQNKKKLKT